MDVCFSPRSAVLTESRKWWFTRWVFIHAVSRMNKDQIRGLWAPLSILTFIWALGSARSDLCLQQRRKREKNKWSSLKSYSNALSTTAHTPRGMMGDREESQVKKTEEVLRLHMIANDNIYRNIYYFNPSNWRQGVLQSRTGHEIVGPKIKWAAQFCKITDTSSRGRVRDKNTLTGLLLVHHITKAHISWVDPLF